MVASQNHRNQFRSNRYDNDNFPLHWQQDGVSSDWCAASAATRIAWSWLTVDSRSYSAGERAIRIWV